MKLPRLRTVLLTLFAAFALFYVTMAVMLALDDRPVAVAEVSPSRHETVAILGASGTAGDGILKAALADPDIRKIHVITRRTTPRIDAGVAMGKVQMTLHKDYLDYSAITGQMAEADAVYWAIGTSTFGVDEETYRMIHVDFPARFLTEWLGASEKADRSFHYISSSDISADSRMMWAREKVRAEQTLVRLAEGSNLRVILYRPDYIGPTEEQAHIGQNLLYWFFAPVKSAVRATQIGQAMIEVSARGAQFETGDRLGTWRIIRTVGCGLPACSIASDLGFVAATVNSESRNPARQGIQTAVYLDDVGLDLVVFQAVWFIGDKALHDMRRCLFGKPENDALAFDNAQRVVRVAGLDCDQRLLERQTDLLRERVELVFGRRADHDILANSLFSHRKQIRLDNVADVLQVVRNADEVLQLPRLLGNQVIL